jgi:hypothetical protein
MPRPAREFGLRLAALVAVGVVLRAIYLFVIARDVTGIGDWHFYHWQANDLANGLGFDEPFRLRFDGVQLPSAGHPPLYPLALSVVSLLGGTGELAHRALGLLLGGVTIALVGLLGRRVGGDRAGLLSGAICAAYPLMVAVDGALMSETLYGPLIAAALLLAYVVLDHARRRAALALGAVIGLAALTRSEALLLVPLLAWPVAFRAGPGRRAQLVLAALAAAGCALVVAPWTIRNAEAFGRFVPISNNDSTVLAGANCPLTYHGVDLGGWNIECISPRRLDDEAAQAVVWRREGLDYLRDHAARWPVVAVVRVLRVWDLWQPRRQVIFAEGRHRRVEQLGIATYFLLLALAAAGIAALLARAPRRRRDPGLAILLAPAAMVTVSSVIGYGVPRLRHAFEIPLCVLAGAGLLALLDRRAARRRAVV